MNLCFQATLERRAPELTVTRGGDSLRHNGCYPMALCFLCSVFFLLVVVQRFDCELKRAGGRAASLLARAPLRRIPRTKGGVWGGELFTILRAVPGAGRQWF